MDNIADDASGTNKYAQYEYIGTSMIASISHPDVTGGLNLSYGSSGTYGGWDRFGRIVDQHWTDDSAATIDEIQHTYDRNGNRLTRTNALNSALDEVYTYDGLDRLIDTDRNGANLQDWTLDSLGNWRGFTDGAATQTRTNNAANEITGISGTGWIAPVYDAAGNMTSGPKPGDETTRLHFKYDAWNRLVEVKNDASGSPGTTIASYEYDGRNYRVEKTVGADTSDVYYNEAWQALEVRKNGDADPLEQTIWDQRYVDAPVVRFYDANTDGDYADATDSTLYYTQDANFNVTALVDAATGNVVERYSYDPYGKATVYEANWTVRSAGTAYANELQYAGYRFDPETALYQVRNRFYHTTVGTWISRDPIGYEGGLNFYEYVGDRPLIRTDPRGLWPGYAPGGGAWMPGRPGTIFPIRPCAPPVGLPNPYGPGSFWPYPDATIPNLPTMPTPPHPCAGYDKFVGSKCTEEDECGTKTWVIDPYPAKAKKVCEGFIDIYNYAPSAVCVAQCLTSFEATITNKTSCSERNAARLNAHVYCYMACAFVPDKGMPEGAPDVGWEMLLPDWWHHYGILRQ